MEALNGFFFGSDRKGSLEATIPAATLPPTVDRQWHDSTADSFLFGRVPSEMRAPFKAHCAATADPQLSSGFLSKLPLEVRKLIYVELWRTGGHEGKGLRQHVLHRNVRTKTGAETIRYIHVPCVLPPTQLTAEEKLGAGAGASIVDDDVSEAAEAAERKRLDLTWALHTDCLKVVPEEVLETETPKWSPFIAALLTCKRLYLECFESIFDSITFVLTDKLHAEKFPGSYPAETLRHLEISIRLPTSQNPRFYSSEGVSNKSAAAPWHGICDSLARPGTNLLSLHIRLNVLDTWLWHARVPETILCKRLLDVSVSSGNFTLDLPERPQRPPHPNTPLLSEEFLVENLGNGPGKTLPFVLRRGERTFVWHIHPVRQRFQAQRALQEQLQGLSILA